MKNSKNVLNIFVLVLGLVSCNTTDPKLDQGLVLKLQDVSCTEAWLHLTTNNIQLPATINVLKNNSVSQILNINNNDTLVYLDSLVPNYNYKFKFVITDNTPQLNSNEVNVQTMDTTSHNFTWEFYEFGEHSSPSLNDVAIIDENNIWAVGEIAFDDSLGNTTTYNAIHWDGTDWELKMINVVFMGSIVTPPLEGVFAFSSTDIWFVGSLPIHGNGTDWILYDLRTSVDPSLSLSKAWGTNSNDMWFVGNNGSIVHYNGSSWQKINSGTTLPIQDIWGATDQTSGEVQVLCIASNKFQNEGKKLLKIESNISNALPDADLSWSLSSIWFKANRKYYIVGDGIYPNTSLNNIWQRFIGLPLIYKNSIRGDNYNSIAVCGAFGFLSHFNGYTWQNFGGNELPSFSGGYLSVAITDKTIIAVGYNQTRAVIAMGKR